TGGPANNYCYVSPQAGISGDGRWVVFQSDATNLDPDVVVTALSHGYAHDRQTGKTMLVDGAPGGILADHSSFNLRTPAAGPSVAFLTMSTNLPMDGNGDIDSLFVRDLQTGALEIEDTNSLGVQANAPTTSVSLSADGRLVCFSNWATN